METKVLNDLGEKVHRMGEMLVERPTLGRVITNTQSGRWSEEIPFAYYVLYICLLEALSKPIILILYSVQMKMKGFIKDSLASSRHNLDLSVI